MTQADLARLCDLVRGVSRLLLGVAGVACYLLVRPVVRRVGGNAPIKEPIMTDEETVRHDCAFCHRERTAKDDNHALDCPYWDFFSPASEKPATY